MMIVIMHFSLNMSTWNRSRCLDIRMEISFCVITVSVIRSFLYMTLIHYVELAFYIDKKGKRVRKDWCISWEGSPTAFSFRFPYVVAFNTNFIEVRHIDTVSSIVCYGYSLLTHFFRVICYRSYQGTTFAAYVQIQQTEFMAWWMIVLQDLKSSLSSSWLILIVERSAWWRIETRRSISSDVPLSFSL